MHNFNFPFVIPSSNTNLNLVLDTVHAGTNLNFNPTCIIPFTKDKDNQVKVSSQAPKELISLLKEESINVFFNNVTYIFVYIKNIKEFEKTIASQTSKIKTNNTFVLLEGFEYNPILLSSEIIFTSKKDWNMKSKKSELDNISTPNSIFLIDTEDKINISHVTDGQNQAIAQSFVQYLVKLPCNVLRPSTFKSEIEKFITHMNIQGIHIKQDGIKEITEMGMGSFSSVAKGSTEEPALITMSYTGASKEDKPYVFVGKGLTFDAGGISLKPSKGMDKMKGDMAGAATAAGIIIYAALSNLPVNVVSILACCENLPDGNALKPGDVITAMNGKTIEVIDTDAEGRLVLADALVYSQRFQGKVTIDLATLTGACIVALSHVHTGLFTKEERLAVDLSEAGREIKDTVWHMPMEGYEFLLESDIADMSNLKLGVGGGSQNGAVFLAEFAPENWVHLDIAGTSETPKGETGRPLPLLAQFLRNEVK